MFFQITFLVSRFPQDELSQQHSQRRRWIWVQKGNCWFNCDSHKRYPWCKRKWLASSLWVHWRLWIHLSFYTGGIFLYHKLVKNLILLMFFGWLSYCIVRYSTFWVLKGQKPLIQANTYGIFITEYILRMPPFEPVLWAHWQNLVLWLIHWRWYLFKWTMSSLIFPLLLQWVLLLAMVTDKSKQFFSSSMFQPRVFILLRRCLFDSDDEVCYIYFEAIHLGYI